MSFSMIRLLADDLKIALLIMLSFACILFMSPYIYGQNQLADNKPLLNTKSKTDSQKNDSDTKTDSKKSHFNKKKNKQKEYKEQSHSKDESSTLKSTLKKKRIKRVINTKDSRSKSSNKLNLTLETDNGFLHEKNSAGPGKLSSTLLALTLGTLIHGTGHWRMGKKQVALRLVILECLGLASILSSILIQQLADSSAVNQASSLLLGHIGAVLFWGSWIADVMGSYQGTTGFSRDTSRLNRSYFSVGYRYLNDEQFNLTHHIVAQLGIHHRLAYIDTLMDLESEQKLLGLNLDFGLHVFGKKALLKKSAFTLSIGSIFRRWNWSDEDLTQVVTIPYVAWSYSFGSFLRGLKNTTFYQKLGIGYESYQFQKQEDKSIFAKLFNELEYTRTIFYLESGFRFNIFEKTSLNIAYMQDDSRDIQPLQDQQQLWLLRIINQRSQSFDLMSEFIVGETWSFWLVLKYQINQVKPRFRRRN
jgi:hypothetical protein